MTNSTRRTQRTQRCANGTITVDVRGWSRGDFRLATLQASLAPSRSHRRHCTTETYAAFTAVVAGKLLQVMSY
jgi:hypothetical protein